MTKSITVIPYMWRVDMGLLTSEISYMVGILSDSIKQIKPSLSPGTIIFDLDQREIQTNK